ncbi:hypothetical protein C7B76_27415, partial [filamentous cyanobacterium CCP2]
PSPPPSTAPREEVSREEVPREETSNEEELTEASRALLYGEEEDDGAFDDDELPFSDLPASSLPPELDRPKLPSTWLWLAALVLVAFIAGALGFVLWSNLLDGSGSNEGQISPTPESPQ